MQSLYETPDDVDLTVGGSLENHVDGTLSGPTFLCILIKQFRKTRMSDSYWFETPNEAVGFTIGKQKSKLFFKITYIWSRIRV